MLLLHGWACSAYSFANLFEPLANAGFRPIALELPGHSLSDKPAEERAYSLAAITSAVEQAMPALGVGRVSIVGHSMGTAIALELAQRRPSDVDRLALITPLGLDRIRVTAFAHAVSPALAGRLAPVAVPRSAVKAVLRTVCGRRRPPTERDVDFYWAPTAFPEFGYAMVALLRRFDWSALSEARLNRIGAPTLLVCGTRDPLVRHRTVARHATAMPDARVVVLRDVGHVPLAEAPEESVPTIVRFLGA